MSNALKEGLVAYYPLQSNAVNMVDGVAGTINGTPSWVKNHAGKVVLDDTTASVTHGSHAINTVCYFKEDGKFYAVLNGVPYMIDEELNSSFISCVNATSIGCGVADINYMFSIPPTGTTLVNQGKGGSTYNLTGVNAISGGAFVATESMAYGATLATGFIFNGSTGGRHFISASTLPLLAYPNYTGEVLFKGTASTGGLLFGQYGALIQSWALYRSTASFQLLSIQNNTNNIGTAISNDIVLYVVFGIVNNAPYISINGGAKIIGNVGTPPTTPRKLSIGYGDGASVSYITGTMSGPKQWFGRVPTDAQIATRNVELLAGTAQLGTWVGL
ncbi:MAG: hypothetical protein M0R06_21190 [Sphaerochaeta sp.]|jgi:hypothetical protein|nr:hypothetical protein [Sphaerochaeta sp.]